MLKLAFLIPNWLRFYWQKRLLIVGLLNFTAGIPVLLKSGTFTVWLAESGISKTTIGLFGIVTLPYALRFLWAPFVDRLPLPWLSQRFGRRRSWLLLSQMSLILGLSSFSLFNPAQQVGLALGISLFISFAAAVHWIVVLAYQMEMLPQKQYGPGEGISALGYRLGMSVIGGATALKLSEITSWGNVYLIMAGFLLIGSFTVLLIPEPEPLHTQQAQKQESEMEEYLHSHASLSPLVATVFSWLYAAVVCPFLDFIKRPGWLACLLLMLTYRLGDDLIGPMSNIFYLELGFSKSEIAQTVKIFGMGATILGGLIGGIYVAHFGFMKSLLWCGLMHSAANLMYFVMLYVGHNIEALYLAVALESITSGMRMTALLSFQMVLCKSAYAATQLALLASVVSLGYTIFSPFSGVLIDGLGWFWFFTITAVAVLPSFFIILYLQNLKAYQ